MYLITWCHPHWELKGAWKDSEFLLEFNFNTTLKIHAATKGLGNLASLESRNIPVDERHE